MKEIQQYEKDFLDGKITVNELRAKKGLRPIKDGNIKLTGERKKYFSGVTEKPLTATKGIAIKIQKENAHIQQI